MSDLDRVAVLDALSAAYQNVTAVAGGLGEAGLMRPSRCAGWAVADVLYHQLLDARRALRTFASPSDGPVDCDDVSYWTDYAPAATGDAPAGGGSAGGGPAYADESAAHAQAAYERFGVPSYWVVIPDTGKPELIAFELRGGHYAEAARVSGSEPFAAVRPFAVEAVPARLVAGLVPPGT